MKAALSFVLHHEAGLLGVLIAPLKKAPDTVRDMLVLLISCLSYEIRHARVTLGRKHQLVLEQSLLSRIPVDLASSQFDFREVCSAALRGGSRR